MRAAFAFALAFAFRAAALANAETLPWSIELGVRGAASFAVDENPMSRTGAVPSMVIRVQRDVGPVYIGANLAGGLPAYLGQHEASLSLGLSHAVRDGRCIRADLDADEQCDARLVLLGGIDAGITLFHFDAPPELSSDSDALLYWGPLGRARVAFRATWTTPTGKEIGVTVGAGVAAVWARYMTTATGSGVRVEPELDMACTIGF
jgi:hypothetical protein